MKQLFLAIVVSGSVICLSQAQTSNTFAAAKVSAQPSSFDRVNFASGHEKTRDALLPLLRGVFHAKRKDKEVLLTVDAGWRNDSLCIEYRFYKGQNLLTLENRFLVEQIYFTMDPAEMNELETENDEFLFLYLRNTRRIANVSNLRFAGPDGTMPRLESWTSSCGFPVRPENLPLIIQYLKELRGKG